jgi:hypothetical protein
MDVVAVAHTCIRRDEGLRPVDVASVDGVDEASTVEIAAASSALTRNASPDGEGLAPAANALWLGTVLAVSVPDGRVGGADVVIAPVGVGTDGLAQAPTSRLATTATTSSGKSLSCPRAASTTTFYTRCATVGRAAIRERQACATMLASSADGEALEPPGTIIVISL